MKLRCRNILCPIDFSRVSIEAIRLATELAEDNGASVHLLCVVPPEKPEARADLEKLAHESLRAIARKWLEGKVAYEITVKSGRPAAAILKAAGDVGADLVVMATRGRTGRERVRLGSVTEEVVRRSTRPVMTVRPDIKSA